MTDESKIHAKNIKKINLAKTDDRTIHTMSKYAEENWKKNPGKLQKLYKVVVSG